MSDKSRGIKHAKWRIHSTFDDLHPTDKVEAYREIAQWTTEKADTYAEHNEENGVPEREVEDGWRH